MHFARCREVLVTVGVAVGICLLATSPVEAQPIRLNPDNTYLGGIETSRPFQLSKDQTWVSFFDGTFENVYRVPSQGGAIEQLRLPPQVDGRVSDWRLLPDGDRIVYQTNKRNTQGIGSQVLVASFDQTNPEVIVSDALGSLPFTMNSTGTHVAYHRFSDPSFRSPVDLVLLPLDGRPPTIVDLSYNIYTPDARYLLFSEFGSAARPSRLHRLTLENGSIADITPDLGPHGSMSPYLVHGVSPDGQYVAIQTRDSALRANQIHSVKIATAESSLLASSTESYYGPAIFTADSRTVAFRESPINGLLEYVSTVPIAGGNPIRLNPDTPDGRRMDGFVFPTFPSDLVAYRVSEAVSPCAFGPIIVSELYVVKVTGGTPTLVSQSIDKSMLSARTIVDITFSPDGSRIMYQDGFLDCKQFSGVNLVSAAVDGSEQVTLSFPMTNGRSGIGKYKISPDGSLVLFSQSIADDNRQMGLFVVPANGGTPLLLSQPIGDSSGITDFELVQSSEGLRAVYLQNEFFGPGPGNYQVRSHLFSVLVPPIPEPNSIAAFLIFLLLAPPLTRRQ